MSKRTFVVTYLSAILLALFGGLLTGIYSPEPGPMPFQAHLGRTALWVALAMYFSIYRPDIDEADEEDKEEEEEEEEEP